MNEVTEHLADSSAPDILLEGKTGDLLPGVLEGPEDEGLPDWTDRSKTDARAIGYRLEQVREECGYSDVAPFYRDAVRLGRFGGSYSAALDYHKGETMPSPLYLVAVASFTGTDLCWLMTGVEQPEAWGPIGDDGEDPDYIPGWLRFFFLVSLLAFLALLAIGGLT